MAPLKVCRPAPDSGVHCCVLHYLPERLSPARTKIMCIEICPKIDFADVSESGCTPGANRATLMRSYRRLKGDPR